jgi:protoporphyrinogen/coproporphyrinogen III oxidase
MRVVVVGAGPAGLTAAVRLQQSGHDVTVLEARDEVGGRTHTEHFGPGHWSDTGAGWLASFYPRTLALLDELGYRDLLRPMPLRGGGDLMLDGEVVPWPSSLKRIVTSPQLSPADKARFLRFMTTLLATQPGGLRVDERHDHEPALDALAPAGPLARDRVLRPLFEGPFFSRLEELSGSLVRSWLRVLSVGQFFQVEGGMDRPWRRIADVVGARTGITVSALEERSDGVDVTSSVGTERFDAGVVAVPAPVAATIGGPAWLGQVAYAPHVRLYAARRGIGPPRRGVHVFPNELVATVEVSSGRGGAWGRVPADWTWALVCAPAATSDRLLAMEPDEAKDALWTLARRIDPGLFSLDSADIVHLIRWERAVPIVGPGYYARLRQLVQGPRVAYAGDWLVQPCVEGAVRSGEAAAAALI